MSREEVRAVGEYEVRRACRSDIESARTLMLDTFYRVMGHGYVSEWHADVIEMEASYFRTPGHALFVAVLGDEVVGTASVRASGPKSPPHPRWIADRYGAEGAAQIFRTYVRPEHRRHGLARELVDMACGFIADEPGYDTIYLHTNPAIEGAESFWRGVAKEVYDARQNSDYSPVVHFEIPVPVSG
ncbi:GNAT family N-acetyltransferase [Parasphingorhabdus pacifica]